jgi:hypothetical protein
VAGGALLVGAIAGAVGGIIAYLVADGAAETLNRPGKVGIAEVEGLGLCVYTKTNLGGCDAQCEKRIFNDSESVMSNSSPRHAIALPPFCNREDLSHAKHADVIS